MAVNSPVAVPAGEVFTQGFNAKGNIRVDYSFRSGDGDPVDAGFIRASDLAEYRQGSAVETWAYRQNTIDVQAGTTLPDGDFVFVLHCRNAFMDCDGVYGLWATY